MQNSQLPAKWYKPFAADDSAKVEIPLTTPDPTRASQSLGFPPLTMQPPESGGVPPQGEDFNGAMNQVARIAWWLMAGGAMPFDNTWATNAAIGGYPQGGVVTSTDLQGEWISIADNNTNDPDTNGAGWVPGFAYGSTVVAGLTNANVILTPAQAAKDIIRLTGALTGNIQIIFPAWQKSWIVLNNCTGAFSVTCKTAAGGGAGVSQGGGMQLLWGDGTNLNAYSGNSLVPQLVGPATLAGHALQLGQATGRLLGVQAFGSSGTYTPTAGTTFIRVEGIGGGGAGGGAQATDGTSVACGSGGASGSWGMAYGPVPGAPVTVTIGSGGAGVSGGFAGGNGGTTSLGTLAIFPGGGGGQPAATSTTGFGQASQSTPGAVPSGSMGPNLFASSGQPGSLGWLNSGTIASGQGALSPYGGGGTNTAAGNGNAAAGYGAGGSGGASAPSNPARTGGAGRAGLIIIYEYS